jgi:hypothetical protein
MLMLEAATMRAPSGGRNVDVGYRHEQQTNCTAARPPASACPEASNLFLFSWDAIYVWVAYLKTAVQGCLI